MERNPRERIRWAWVFSRAAIGFGAVLTAMAWIGPSDGPPGVDLATTDMISIHEDLRRAGALPRVLPLSFADGRIDALVVAGAECEGCDRLAEYGLPALAEEGRRRGIDLVLLPAPASDLGLALEAAAACIPAWRRPDGLTHFRNQVAAVREMRQAYLRVLSSSDGTSAGDAAILEELEHVMSDLSTKSGGAGDIDRRCYQAEMMEISGILDGLPEYLDLRTGAGLYMQDGEVVVRMSGILDEISGPSAIAGTRPAAFHVK